MKMHIIMFMEIIKKFLPEKRPYWFVDAKWVCGLLLIFCLMTTLLVATAIQLTDQSRAPKIAALTVGSMFIRGDSLDIDEAKEALKKQGGVIHPIPSMPEIIITEKDLALSTADIKLKVFLPLTTALYQDGIDATAQRFGKTEEQKEKFKKDASMLAVFTKGTHNALQERLILLIALSLLLLLGVMYFSAGWGRLANPGLLLFFVSLPGTFAALLITNPPRNGNGGVLGFLPPDIAASIGTPIGHVYYWITISGLLLLGVALVGTIITHIIDKKRKK